MKYKIDVYLNRIDRLYLEDFEKARQYHLKHGVDLEFTFRDISVTGYTSKLSTIDAGFQRYLLVGSTTLVPPTSLDATIFTFDIAEWATPLGSPFPLKGDAPSGDCTIYMGKPFINIGVYPTEHANGQTWIKIAHEIMHALVFTVRIKGNQIQDVMDTYLHNDNPDRPDGNFSQQWKLLAPFIQTTTRSKAFEIAVENTLTHEGGYSNDPKDGGGETNFGISKKAYPNVNIKTLTKEQAKDIYYSDYWLKIKGDSMPLHLSVNVFDMAVNAGVSTAVKMMQSALGLVADGAIGPVTLQAMGKATMSHLEAFCAFRIGYYVSLKDYPVFGKGWIKRAVGTLIKSIWTN